jgi:hypothetical protein
MCGKYIQDCSCNPTCKSRGNCCFDFEKLHCEDKLVNSLTQDSGLCQLNDKCELCDNQRLLIGETKIPYCNLCNNDSYRFKGRCYRFCPTGTRTDPINKICVQYCIFILILILFMNSM